MPGDKTTAVARWDACRRLGDDAAEAIARGIRAAPRAWALLAAGVAVLAVATAGPASQAVAVLTGCVIAACARVVRPAWVSGAFPGLLLFGGVLIAGPWIGSRGAPDVLRSPQLAAAGGVLLGMAAVLRPPGASRSGSLAVACAAVAALAVATHPSWFGTFHRADGSDVAGRAAGAACVALAAAASLHRTVSIAGWLVVAAVTWLPEARSDFAVVLSLLSLPGQGAVFMLLASAADRAAGEPAAAADDPGGRAATALRRAPWTALLLAVLLWDPMHAFTYECVSEGASLLSSEHIRSLPGAALVYAAVASFVILDGPARGFARAAVVALVAGAISAATVALLRGVGSRGGVTWAEAATAIVVISFGLVVLAMAASGVSSQKFDRARPAVAFLAAAGAIAAWTSRELASPDAPPGWLPDALPEVCLAFAFLPFVGWRISARATFAGSVLAGLCFGAVCRVLSEDLGSGAVHAALGVLVALRFAVLVVLLRRLAWLTPVPETHALLADWAVDRRAAVN